MTGNDNTNDNPNNTIFTMKDTKLYVPAVTLSTKVMKNYQNFLAKILKGKFIGMNIKESENKNATNEYRFPKSNFAGVNRL